MSTRVEQIIEEIARLTPEEREQLRRLLPDVINRSTESTRERLAALEQAITHREGVRARLLTEGKPLFSIDDEIEAMREERVAELTAALPSAQSRDRDHGER
ncbi:MAG TPA: hypothetical protein VFW96_24625 [Thermomicrobiales bacterium]|nr:hypothetical protein [Thermomicrobiales bacterium]